MGDAPKSVVEAVIRAHPAIRDAAVTGDHAIVRFVDDDVVSWAALIAYCREHLPAASVPSSFEVGSSS